MLTIWHQPKYEEAMNGEHRMMRSVFGPPDVATKCGCRVEEEQLRTYEQYIADKGANADMWCHFYFGGQG